MRIDRSLGETPGRDLASIASVALVAIGGLAFVSRLGDYLAGAGPAVAALAGGSFTQAAAVPLRMGPFSILLRAPFAWLAHLAGAGQRGEYRIGIVVCFLVAAALGLALAAGARRGRSWPLVVPLLAILSPASFAAVRLGHPEEALGGALCVAAVLLAARSRHLAAALALGLAVATKQWALIAVAPTLLAAGPGNRLRLAATGAAVAALLYVPFVATDPHAFASATRAEARVVAVATPESLWFAASDEAQIHVQGSPTLTYHRIPHWLPPLSHAAIVLAGVPLALLLAKRRRRGAADALALLTLAFLARCVLDPVDIEYYHLPFFLTLLAWEVTAGKLRDGVPVITIGVAAALWSAFDVLPGASSPWVVNAIYLTGTLALAAYLLGELGVLRSFRRGAALDRRRLRGHATPS